MGTSPSPTRVRSLFEQMRAFFHSFSWEENPELVKQDLTAQPYSVWVRLAMDRARGNALAPQAPLRKPDRLQAEIDRLVILKQIDLSREKLQDEWGEIEEASRDLCFWAKTLGYYNSLFC